MIAYKSKRAFDRYSPQLWNIMNEHGPSLHRICLCFCDWCSHFNVVPQKWGISPAPWSISLIVSSYSRTLLRCFVRWSWNTWSEEREHRVAHEQVNWDSVFISVLLSVDSAGFPVALSWPQCLILQCKNAAKCRDLLYTNHTVLISQQTAVCLQHMSNLYIIWFTEKCFLECLCMNLNFKLLLFGVFLKHRPILKEKLCKYLTYFISRNQKIYLWSQHKKQCFWLKRCISRLRPIHPDLIICFMNVFFCSQPGWMFSCVSL